MTDETKRGPTPPHMAAGGVDPADVGRIEQPKPVAKAAAKPEPEKPAPAKKAEQRLSAHPVLSDEEVAQAKARAKAKLEDERRKYALAEVEKQELDRLRSEEGMVVGGIADEMVSITIDLPDFAANLTTNFTNTYWHGHTYTLPRHVANDLAYRMQTAWQHQYKEIDGKKLHEIYQRQRATVLSAVRGATNAPTYQEGAKGAPRDL